MFGKAALLGCVTAGPRLAVAARLKQPSWRSSCGHYVAITTEAMRVAARFWADARSAGAPTAAPEALDADVILAAQALTAGIPAGDVVIATTNVGHLSRFLSARSRRDITV